MCRKGNPNALLVEMLQNVAATVENSMGFPQKIKNDLPFDPVILLLRSYPRNPETPTQEKLCKPMFIAAVFTIAKCWKQLKCPSVHEWIKNYGTFTQWNTMQQKERKNSYLLQQYGWKWRALC